MIHSTIKSKKCPKCGKEFPATTEFFYAQKGCASGLCSRCKPCYEEGKKDRRNRPARKRLQHRDGMKTCSKCLNEYPETSEYFYALKTGHKGLHPECKTCHGKRAVQWQESHPEKRKEIAERYVKNNPEKRVETSRKYNAKHLEESKERTRNWRRNNPARHAAQLENRRARRLGNGGTYTVADIQAQYDQQHGQCYYCEKPLNGKYHVDHVIPLSKGGRNDPSNLVCACESCNLHKSSRTLEQWLAFIADPALLEKVERLMSVASQTQQQCRS